MLGLELCPRAGGTCARSACASRSQTFFQVEYHAAGRRQTSGGVAGANDVPARLLLLAQGAERTVRTAAASTSSGNTLSGKSARDSEEVCYKTSVQEGSELAPGRPSFVRVVRSRGRRGVGGNPIPVHSIVLLFRHCWVYRFCNEAEHSEDQMGQQQ